MNILTVTPDPVYDRTLFIEAFTRGELMHAGKTVTSVGGKGLDSSVALTHLGVPTTALAFLAGATGQNLSDLVAGYDIPLAAIWAGGETRTATILAEQQASTHSHIFSGGLTITADERHAFIERYRALLAQADFVISGGILPSSLPEDFFAVLIREAVAQGKPFLLDSFGPYMRAGIKARPTIAKLNHHELHDTFTVPFTEFADLIEPARAIRERYAVETLVVTCGAEGILLLCNEGIYHARPPVQRVVSAAGAGDAASAALAWRRLVGDDWPDAVCWAAAVSAAAVLTERTADFALSDVERILPDVHVRVLGQ